jgi:hypothetical protein
MHPVCGSRRYRRNGCSREWMYLGGDSVCLDKSNIVGDEATFVVRGKIWRGEGKGERRDVAVVVKLDKWAKSDGCYE